MSWTTLDPTANADNLDWGTSNLGTITSQTTEFVVRQRLSSRMGTLLTIERPSLSSLLYAPGATDGLVPELVRPVSGPIEAVGGGGSVRPTSGMLYPRGQG